MCDSIAEKLVQFSPGEFLFRQGDNTNELYILKSGEVRIFKIEGSSEVELDRAVAGMIVGEIASIDGGVRSASGIALKPVQAYCISGEKFRSLTKEIPEWLKKIAFILAKRLREIDEKINSVTDSDKSVQVGALLSLICNSKFCKPCEQGFEINLKFLENEIIDILNIQYSETLTILQHFAAKKIIRLERSKIIIENKDALKEMADKVFIAPFPTPAT